MRDNDFTSFSVVNYSLVLNSYLWTRHDAANIILYYAIDREAKKINVSAFDAFSQIVFFYARHRDYLPTAINDVLDNIEGFSEAAGDSFAGEDYCPEFAIDLLTTFCAEHAEFSDMCKDWYRFFLAFTGQAKFNFEFDGDKFGYLEACRQLFPPSNGVPSSLPLQMILEAQGKNEAKDIAMLAMYSAIRSIVGRKELATTTKAFIHARMLGAKNTQELADMCLKDKALKRCAEAWRPDTHRKLFNNMLRVLRKKNLISYYGDSARRCMYVTTSLLDIKDFAFAIVEARRQHAHRRDARQMVEYYLNNPP